MSGSGYEAAFVSSLLFTVAVETAVLFTLVTFRHKGEFSPGRVVFAGVVPSAMTLPYLWFLWPLLFIGNRMAYVVSGELLVTVIEALMIGYLLGVRKKDAFLYSLAANGTSCGLGFLLS